MGSPSAEAGFAERYRINTTAVRPDASLCVPAAPVDDVVGDTFLVAWRRFSDIPADWSRGRVIGVTRNAVRRRHRSALRATDFVRQLIDLRPDGASALDGDDVALGDVEVLQCGLAELDADDREMLLLDGPYGMNSEETSLALGTKPNAIGARLHRARSRPRAACDREVLDAGHPR